MLAAGIETGQPTISRYLGGQLPKAEELLKLARFFDVPMEVLIGADALRAEGDAAERKTAKEAARLTKFQPPILAIKVKSLRDAAARLRKTAAEMVATAADLEKQADQIAGPVTRGRKPGQKRA